jgi:hypothetical protein
LRFLTSLCMARVAASTAIEWQPMPPSARAVWANALGADAVTPYARFVAVLRIDCNMWRKAREHGTSKGLVIRP